MFSKKPADDSRPVVAKPVNNSSTFSVIGPDVTIRGDIAASADLHVDGRIEGDLNCASLVQGDGSSIMGSIEAASARLAGHVNGSISVRDLVILKSARIEGDVEYDALTIEQGAEVEGRLCHGSTSAERAERPADRQRVAQGHAPTEAAADDADDEELRLSLAG